MLHLFTAVTIEMPQCETTTGSNTGRENFALQKRGNTNAQVRLAAHIKVYHPEISRAERFKLNSS